MQLLNDDSLQVGGNAYMVVVKDPGTAVDRQHRNYGIRAACHHSEGLPSYSVPREVVVTVRSENSDKLKCFVILKYHDNSIVVPP